MRRRFSTLTRWWASQPRKVKIAGAATLAVGLPAIGVLAWAMLSGSSSQPAGVNGLTVETVYSGALQSMYRPGFILHTTVTYQQATTRAGDTVTPKSELWLDGEADAARIHWTGITEGYADESENLIVGGYIYNIHRPINPGEKTSAERDNYKNPCSGSNHAVIGVLFECYQLPVDATTTVPVVETEEFEGRQLLAIVIQTTASTSAESVTIHNALYLDPDTFLPVANVTEYSTANHSVPKPAIARYQNEFLERTQVAADFFDPHAVGYGLQNAAQLLDALAQKTLIYWLGEEPNFDATVCTVPHAGSCPLVLEHVNASPRNGAKGQLAYSYGDVTIEYWPPGYLDELRSSSVGQMLENTRCANKSETDVGGRTAVIYVLTPITYPLVTPQQNDPCYPRFDPSGGGPIYDGAVGYVDYGDVVVEVDGPEPGVYVSRRAIEAVLNALQRR